MASNSEIRHLALGVKCNPPTLILQYKIMKTVKLRTMPIRDLNKSTDCYKLAGKKISNYFHELDFLKKHQKSYRKTKDASWKRNVYNSNSQS